MSPLNPFARLLQATAIAGALAGGIGELARLQGWRLRARWLRKAR